MVRLSLLSTFVLALASTAPALAAPVAADAPSAGIALDKRDDGYAKRLQKRVPLVEERAIPNARAKRATAADYYSALVAIGASYTDNAHSRPSQYAVSLRDYYPYSKWGGRYSNGPVAVEYMAQSGLKQGSSGVKLLDYAYGGSVVQNQLSGTGSSWPAAKDQIASYLSDLDSGSAAIGSGRVLHYFNSGINSVMQIWNNALWAGLSSAAISNAKAAITANTMAYAAAIRSINTDSIVASKVHGADFLLVGIPALEIVPTVEHQIPSSYSSAKRSQALSLMQELASQYNSEVKAFATALSSESKNGKVWFYDLSALWYSMHSSPKDYGMTSSVTSTCYNSCTGGVCSNPTAYLYFDTLHPVTSVHKLMAQKMAALVSA